MAFNVLIWWSKQARSPCPGILLQFSIEAWFGNETHGQGFATNRASIAWNFLILYVFFAICSREVNVSEKV